MAITVKEMHEDYDWREAWAWGGGKHVGEGVNCSSTSAKDKGCPEGPSICEGARCSAEPVSATDVAEVIAASEGENDGEEWVAVARLNDGRFAFVEAGCDYTGWDCQAGGQVWVSDSLDNLWQFGVTDDARSRLGDGMPGVTP